MKPDRAIGVSIGTINGCEVSNERDAPALTTCISRSFGISTAAGWAAPWYAYPTLTLPQLDVRPLIACLLLCAPVLVWRARR